MSNLKIILAALVIFGTGVVTGGLLVNHVQRCSPKTLPVKVGQFGQTNSMETAEPAKLLRPSDILSKNFLQQLDGTLHLTPEQRTSIEKAIAERQSQIRRTLQDARLEIREILQPGQLAEFDEMVKRLMIRRIAETNVLAGMQTNVPGASFPAKR